MITSNAPGRSQILRTPDTSINEPSREEQQKSNYEDLDALHRYWTHGRAAGAPP